jgi:ABC-type antimicrobial peptide transport system permease subunit
LAIAIALVLVVSGLGNGIKAAQAQALSGLYGVGTDISVSKTVSATAIRQRFQLGAGEGATSGQTRTFSRTRLRTQFGAGTLTAAEVQKISATSGVKLSAATLKLTSTTFNGTLPTFTQGGSNGASSGQMSQFTPQPNASSGTGSAASSRGGFSGGFNGAGGSQFDITSFTVEGVPTDVTSAGPLAGVKLVGGRNFVAADANTMNVVVDHSYAVGQKLTVGGKISINSKDFIIIGIVQSATADSTPSNTYIPIAEAQTLASMPASYTNDYIVATDSGEIPNLKTALESQLPGATVSSQEDLASNVSGSLGTASSLTREMGGWLSVIVLLASFLTAILFTTSGVNRRVREFGTLKAIGWKSNRIVRQVLGESIVNSLIGGVLGVAIGLGGVALINGFGPSLSASVARNFGGFGGGGFGGGGRFGQQAATNAMHVALTASVEPYMFALAIGFALIGGLLAGAFGGLRAAKLSPSEALRSVN